MFNKQFVDDEKRNRLVDSVKAEKSLAEFTKQAWDIIEPSTPLIWNWHLDTICGYLEALHERRIKRLIINIPPGAMKSLLVSVMYPCWVWQKDPGHRFLGISNEQGLSIRDALKAKWIMSDEWYSNYWPVEFQADQNQKTLYANTDKGFRQSLGITGNITGKRGDCVDGSTLVSTEIGDIRIDILCMMRYPPKVFSLNHKNNEIELKPIVETKSSIVDKTIELVTRFSHIICTPDHLVYAGDDYKEAKNSNNLMLLELQKPINASSQIIKNSLLKSSYENAQVKQSLCAVIDNGSDSEHNKGRETVYDIQVEGNHNFFGNGILVHNCLLIDDPHDATGAQSELQRQTVLNTYDQKLSSRVNSQEDSAIVLIMQRLHEMDLTGHLLNKKKTNWVHLSIPMEYEGSSSFDAGKDIGRPDLNDIRTKDGELLFPGLFSADAVKRQKEDMGEYGSAGQLQQRPSPAGGGILKKHWWRIWPDDMAIPVCEHLFLSWDTAYSEKDLKSNSFSAMVAFGVFWHEQDQRYCLIMIDAWDGQVDYPKLRKLAIKLTKDRKPDIHLIEKKASGQSLVQDLRQAKIGVRTYNPDRDKVARAYAVSALLASGVIYAPNRRWADRVIDMLAIFPNGASPSSDYTDCVTQALLYLKNGAWVENPDDIDGEDIDTKRYKERVAAYG